MNRQTEPAPPSSDYKGGDIGYRGLAYATLGLAVLVGGAAAASFLLFSFFQSRQAQGDPPASPFGEVRIVPPAPRLQVEPADDLRAMEAEMERLLGSYEWVDRERGLVRVPIERAMEVVAGGGGPAPVLPPAEGAPGAPGGSP